MYLVQFLGCTLDQKEVGPFIEVSSPRYIGTGVEPLTKGLPFFHDDETVPRAYVGDKRVS